ERRRHRLRGGCDSLRPEGCKGVPGRGVLHLRRGRSGAQWSRSWVLFVDRICDYFRYVTRSWLSRGVRRPLRPFQAIWTPIHSRIKAMTRRIAWAVEGGMARVIFGAE